ncbi:MAG: nickel insertion protein [Actinomycetota bacterium]
MRVLYFDCIAGISGDMTLGALVDAGVDLGDLRAALATLPLEPFELEAEEVETHGVGATRVAVRTSMAGIIRTYSSIRELIEQGGLSEDATRTAQRIFLRLAQAEARVHRKEVEQVTFHEVGAVDSIVDICGVAVGLDLLGVERVYSSPVPTGRSGVISFEMWTRPIGPNGKPPSVSIDMCRPKASMWGQVGGRVSRRVNPQTRL